MGINEKSGTKSIISAGPASGITSISSSGKASVILANSGGRGRPQFNNFLVSIDRCKRLLRPKAPIRNEMDTILIPKRLLRPKIPIRNLHTRNLYSWRKGTSIIDTFDRKYKGKDVGSQVPAACIKKPTTIPNFRRDSASNRKQTRK